MDKHTAYFNILDALPQSGCAICRLGHEVEIGYIKDVLYSKTTSIKTRAELRDARGFCPSHAMQLDEIGHALDLSIIYQDILLTLKQVLEGPSPQQAVGRRGKRQLVGALASKSDCPACVYRAEMQDVYAEAFVDHLVDPDFVTKVRAADPLCLTHFRQAIVKISVAESFQTLQRIQSTHWERLISELGEFVRKNDHRFRGEAVGREGDAWRRAIDAVVGSRTF